MPIPITTVLKIKPLAGQESECLNWMKKTSVIVSQFSGFLSREIYKSMDQDNLLVTVFTFESKDHLELWENSKERADQINMGKHYVDSLVERRQFTGLEFWFDCEPSSNGNLPPVRWKMLIVTVVTIFILLNTIFPVIQTGLDLLDIPMLLKSFIAVSIVVSIITYAIMPLVNRLLGKWLVKGG